MKTIFIGFYKTIEEYCTVIFQKSSSLKTSNYGNGIASKLVYVLYIPSAVDCISFIKIKPEVLAY